MANDNARSWLERDGGNEVQGCYDNGWDILQDEDLKLGVQVCQKADHVQFDAVCTNLPNVHYGS